MAANYYAVFSVKSKIWTPFAADHALKEVKVEKDVNTTTTARATLVSRVLDMKKFQVNKKTPEAFICYHY